MKALRFHEWGGPLRLEDVADPTPAPGEVLVEVRACGVGRTVLNCISGNLGSEPDKLPRIPGHELVGTIRACGSGVDSGREGELVAAYFYLTCGECRACYAGMQSCCENFAGYLGVDRDGGYAELVTLPAQSALPLPEGLDPVTATVVPDAVATPVHVAGVANIRAGDRVVVVGAAGGVGAHMAQVAALHGATVLGLDVDRRKLDFLADELGVDVADSSDFSSVRLPVAWSGADVVVDFLGSAKSLRWSLDALGVGGRLVVLTTFKDVDVAVSPRQLVTRHQTIAGSRYCGKAEFMRAADLVARGDVRAVIGAQVGLDGITALHDRLAAGEVMGRGALALDG
ncbi:MAG: alcohol dehydrogenase catalytic domain-containing protein [Streptosporangiales bacterium]|nr:alcohol dehydrogenase catalytic domain-containing protein [Streptosporangiales bacterium]MBO0892536.1 alcohol dehydrogenase catalytic domain-containing protein [Acidothermales bacterium]